MACRTPSPSALCTKSTRARGTRRLTETVAVRRRDHGVTLSPVLPLYKWSSPDETERQAAVRSWRR
ncbi:hypothetical protein ABB07_02225 [Streptomyces incarnatus]|uniref:Uncharacterized protein n=1 Tax=Streptomyces incarnatus TaxID=665007 RepID=A0ABN4GC46_9ACTN|nr:hypothetical protein ABB07_02225 [Streptomyces incarnatus]